MPATAIVAGIDRKKPRQSRDSRTSRRNHKGSKQVEQTDYKTLLDRQDTRIRELESQVAAAAKSQEAADAIAKEIEKLRLEAYRRAQRDGGSLLDYVVEVVSSTV